jgi:DNA repair ATPase RecN
MATATATSKLSTSPRPPELPKASKSSISSFLTNKIIKPFENGSIRKSPLLEELSSILAKGLKSLDNDHNSNIFDTSYNPARLEIYKEIFHRYIEECNIYKPLLSAIKYEYDNALEISLSKMSASTSLEILIAAKDQEHKNQLKTLEAFHSQQMKALIEQGQMTQKALQKKTKELEDMSTEYATLKASNQKIKESSDALQATCNTLTNALSRLEEEKLLYAANEVQKNHELIALQNALQKSNDENNRYLISILRYYDFSHT